MCTSTPSGIRTGGSRTSSPRWRGATISTIRAPLLSGLKSSTGSRRAAGAWSRRESSSVAAFDPVPGRYTDARYANDDTPMLRQLAATHGIHVSPEFASDYTPRATLRTFLKHSFHRGMVFLDGHGRRESRFFPAIVAFYPLSASVALACASRPRRLPLVVAATAGAAGIVSAAAGRSRGDTGTVAALAPVWAAAFGAGLWRGFGMLMAGRCRGKDV